MVKSNSAHGGMVKSNSAHRADVNLDRARRKNSPWAGRWRAGIMHCQVMAGKGTGNFWSSQSKVVRVGVGLGCHRDIGNLSASRSWPHRRDSVQKNAPVACA